MKKILITGVAGFIGRAVAHRVLERGDEVVGLDNLNDYYDSALKYDRLATLGIAHETVEWYKFAHSSAFERFRFIRMNLEDRQAVQMLFANEEFDAVINLGAQAGVRYSIENPFAYVESNVDGFITILEGCRRSRVGHLVYASSSSVYGLNANAPFSEHEPIAHPVSLYAATKKADELMAHCYSHLYGLPTTGLRFFTVYGPWGRPDMSPSLFADAIFHKKPIKVFNNGDMLRDFTYIDDIVEGVVRVIDTPPSGNPAWNPMRPDPSSSPAPYKIYNVGNSQPVKLMDFIRVIEEAAGMTAEKIYMPMQSGDVYQTNADTSALYHDFGFRPATPLPEGIAKTVEWYRTYYNL